MSNTTIAYPVSSKRPAWRDGQRFKIVDADGREIAKESQYGTAQIIAEDMNAAEVQRVKDQNLADAMEGERSMISER